MALDDDWALGINPKLHSKVTIIDDKKIFLGSSNLTANGLGLNENDQNESNVFFETPSKPIEIISHLMENTQFLKDTQIKQMDTFLSNLKSSSENFEALDWPEEIVTKIKGGQKFFSTDFPDISINDIGKNPSCFFIDLERNNPKLIFLNSNIYKWLVNKVTNARTEYTNFGWLTNLVQDSLLDIPPVHRADAKKITALLFECVDAFSEEIIVKQHRRTKSMHLKP